MASSVGKPGPARQRSRSSSIPTPLGTCWMRTQSLEAQQQGLEVAYCCTVTLRQCCLGWCARPPLVLQWIVPSESIQKAYRSPPGIVARKSPLVSPQSAGLPGTAALPAQVTSAWQYNMVTFGQAVACHVHYCGRMPSDLNMMLQMPNVHAFVGRHGWFGPWPTLWLQNAVVWQNVPRHWHTGAACFILSCVLSSHACLTTSGWPYQLLQFE